MKLKLIAVFICAMLLGAASGKVLPWIDTKATETWAWHEAIRKLDTERCQAAMDRAFPEWKDKDTNYSDTFRDYVKIHRVDWIPLAPIAIAVTDCDISRDTFVLAEGFVGWVKKEVIAGAYIHEYVHLLRCAEIARDCDGFQSKCTSEYMKAQELDAYQTSRSCMGVD